MGQKKKLRTLIWKNEQLKESVSEYIKELRQKKNQKLLSGEEENKRKEENGKH